VRTAPETASVVQLVGIQRHVYVQDTYIAATNTPARFPPNLYRIVGSMRHWVKYDSYIRVRSMGGSWDMTVVNASTGSRDGICVSVD
jgi:hypothetical protein